MSIVLIPVSHILRGVIIASDSDIVAVGIAINNLLRDNRNSVFFSKI